MRIDHLEITNFKNFENLTVDFAKGVNLFVGNNGSGKTSLLESINIASGAFFGAQENKLQRNIDLSEVRLVPENNSLRRMPLTIIKAYSSIIGKEWSRTFNSNTKANDSKSAKPASEYGNKIISSFNDNEQKFVAPVIAYYSTQRLFKDAAQSSKQKYDASIGRRNGYLQSLKENAIKGTLVEWLGNAVNRRATKQIKEIDQTDLVLENVEHAIRKTLINFLELDANFPLKIYSDQDFDNELFISYDSQHNLPLSYYSDGFRSLIYLVMDLIWRASQLNPWLTLDSISEQVTGCVTIDEIDLHLHPKWQAKAIGLLQALLPNVQFFITTHSAVVVANFKERIDEQGENIDTLFILENNQISKIDSSFYGKDINSVLDNPMDANIRAKEILDLLNEFYEIANDPNSTEEQYASLHVIAKKLKNNLQGTDKEIIAINSILERINTHHQ